MVSADSKLLAIAGGSTGARLWDAVAGKHLLVVKGHSRDVASVTFPPDGKLLASANDKTIFVWDPSALLKR